MVIDSDKHL